MGHQVRVLLFALVVGAVLVAALLLFGAAQGPARGLVNDVERSVTAAAGSPT